MTRKPLILDTIVLAQSRLFSIEELHLRFSNDQERHFERVCGRNFSSIMIIPLLDRETFLLVREYGAGVGDYLLGFPKGAVEKGEDIFVAAERELKEEVGYGSRTISQVARYSASPSYMDSMMHILLAEDLYPEKSVGDEPEPLEIVPWKFSRIVELLDHPEFHEARSVAALLLLERRRACYSSAS